MSEYDELDRKRRVVLSAVAVPEPAGFDELDEERVWDALDMHPLCIHNASTGGSGAVKLSDLFTAPELRGAWFWEEFYAPWGVTDELEVPISTSTRYTRNFIFERTSGTFGEREREILNVLRPHLVALYDRARDRRIAAALVESVDESATAAVVVLGSDHSVELATTAAARLLHEYFGCDLGPALPDELADWLAADQPRTPLLVGGRRRSLSVTLIDDRTLLMREREPADGHALTAREREILALVAEGATNAEIAERLWITVATVRKHLEHAYEKLGVRNRTAAARAFAS
jgi:DNA-binding CsgD family transcriptional regulator